MNRTWRYTTGGSFAASFAHAGRCGRFYDLAGSNALLELGCAALCTPLGRRAAGKIFFGNGSFPNVMPGNAGKVLVPAARRLS